MEIKGDQPALSDALLFLREWEDCRGYIEAHTSGSTGTPKKIRLLKSDMILSAMTTCSFFKIDGDSLLFLPLSPGYIAGKMMIVRAAFTGASLLVENPSNNPLKSDPGRDLSLCAVVPSQLPSLLKSPYVGRIRNLIIGGAPLSPEYESVLAEYEFNAYVTYGMTETCSHVALRKTGEEYYQALSDISFSTDERGCLMINSSERSFKKLVTNDIVELIDSRSFKWKGRYDNVINTGGIKVFPEEIERKIASAVKERAFFITSRESSKWGREVVLVIEGKEVDADLAGKLEALLEKPERPKEIIYVSAIPRTLSGKIKRNFYPSIQ